jgi:methyl-accepting chemotaxis protein
MNHSWTFKTKLSGSLAALVALGALEAGVAVYALRSVVVSKDAVITAAIDRLAAASQVSGGVAGQLSGLQGFLITPIDELLTGFAAGRKEAVEAIKRLEATAQTEEDQQLTARISEAHTVLTKLQEKVISLRTGKNGFDLAARLFQSETRPAQTRLLREIAALTEKQQQHVEETRAAATARASMAVTSVVVLAISLVLCAAVCGIVLAKALSRKIGFAVQHVQSASSELQAVASQQVSGAREAATGISEVSTTISELLATSRQIAESARQVAQIAEETAAAARSGDQVVVKSQESIEGIREQIQGIVNHMLELGRKSQQIGGILDIINELAEQTNILSINASIEAAGAGEQGRRFAVVGDEIRKLADRVSGSTKEMRGLVDEIRGAINTTVLATEGGSKTVDTGLRHFEEVTRGFKQIAGLVMTTTQAAREIELSTKQQSTAVEQVNSAITSAAEASRQTETSSGQMLQTATQLSHLSRDLTEIVQPQAST